MPELKGPVSTEGHGWMTAVGQLVVYKTICAPTSWMHERGEKWRFYRHGSVEGHYISVDFKNGCV